MYALSIHYLYSIYTASLDNKLRHYTDNNTHQRMVYFSTNNSTLQNSKVFLYQLLFEN